MEEEVREEGNRMFGKGRWARAIAKYGQYIALLVGDKTDETTRSKLVVGYSNRAEAWLKVHKYVKALDDCNKALELDNAHLKSLLRKGRALEGLRMFQEAVETYKEILGSSSFDCLSGSVRDSIEISYENAFMKDRQTRFGEIENAFETSWKLFPAGPDMIETPPSLEEYVGPVEIRRVPGMGRGLFATRNVQAGELLLVSNALTTNKISTDDRSELPPLEKKLDHLIYAVEEVVRDAMENLHDLTQLQRLIQLDTLGGPYPEDSQYRDAPPMRYFTPVNALPPGCKSVTAQDMTHPALRNEFPRAFLRRVIYERQIYQYGKVLKILEIYVLPSLMNHSCLPNVSVMGLRNERFSRVFRASRDIRQGEELFHAYHNIFCPLDERRWLVGGVLCKCSRCSLEARLLQECSMLNYMASECTDIGSHCDHLSLSTYTEEQLERLKRRCITAITAVGSLFKDIPKLSALRDDEKDFIRASFVRFYRLLLDPQIKGLPGYSADNLLSERRLIANIIIAMHTCDPASDLALAMCAEAAKEKPFLYNHATDSIEPYGEMEVLLNSGRRILELTYGPELTCRSIFKIFVSYEGSLVYLPF
ncbi:protein MpATXR9 [Marchantia polymorpha subsp. ruderalis]|uniref:SET domain-containing protein n=2 Tax=Marchantia polymorpha TaxID=3197 RepID=A0AAF6BTR3_MARPO|nr:hypothetical protein MARPO_0045s0135 [Marchantia polymorpha]BBN15397.1 hypothetical protein Mp_6g19280 [Marchantia polymorpha subsp. ruderalis]|eukprot:PTQ39491.1 hypothetical protein MARPO_0045s0135 [Marchantia polymorpha]